MEKKVFVILCLLIVSVSCCGCISSDTGNSDTDGLNDESSSSDSQVTDTSGSDYGENDYQESEPTTEEQTKVCPHCGGDPNHICQQCPDGCYLCGGSGYVNE
ncbi:MAG TPA: hypothetical protein PL168_10260 [Methanobacterium sp.]|nr:hypothetical protein [Methanobacterium sp.]